MGNYVNFGYLNVG